MILLQMYFFFLGPPGGQIANMVGLVYEKSYFCLVVCLLNSAY